MEYFSEGQTYVRIMIIYSRGISLCTYYKNNISEATSIRNQIKQKKINEQSNTKSSQSQSDLTKILFDRSVNREKLF